MKFITVINLFFLSCLYSSTILTAQNSQNTNSGLIPTPAEDVLKIQTDVYNIDEFSVLPVSFDLSKHRKFPPFLNQGQTTACTGFALAYALKTFQEAEDRQYSIYDNEGKPIDSLIFSPSYLFSVIKKGTGCNKSVNLLQALLALEIYGAVSLQDMPFNSQELNTSCQTPSKDLLEKGRQNRIANFYRIREDKRSKIDEIGSIIEKIKKRIINYHPVVFGAYMNDQFMENTYNNLHTDGLPIWDNYKKQNSYYHAMLIIGYDEAIKSFKIYNSYGKHGILWMTYENFSKLSKSEIYVTTDVPFRYHDNFKELYANQQEFLAITQEKFDGNTQGNYRLAAGVSEHHFIEESDLIVSNLSIDLPLGETTIEFTDKSLDAQPIKFILKDKEEVYFSIKNRDFNLRIDQVEANRVYFELEVNNEKVLEQIRIAKREPIRIINGNTGRVGREKRAHRFEEINASLLPNGIFRVSAKQTNNNVWGWHGKLIFELIDMEGRILKKIETPSYGQNGRWRDEQIREIYFEVLIDDLETLKQTISIKYHGVKT